MREAETLHGIDWSTSFPPVHLVTTSGSCVDPARLARSSARKWDCRRQAIFALSLLVAVHSAARSRLRQAMGSGASFSDRPQSARQQHSRAPASTQRYESMEAVRPRRVPQRRAVAGGGDQPGRCELEERTSTPCTTRRPPSASIRAPRSKPGSWGDRSSRFALGIRGDSGRHIALPLSIDRARRARAPG